MATLQDKLTQGRFVLTAEVTPPVSAAREDLMAKAQPLKGLADAVNVTDGAGARTHLSALTAAMLLNEAGIEPILQLTCRDRNRIALQSDLLGAAAMGVRNLLVLRGDDPSAGDQPDAKPVFDLDARQLMATARRLRDANELPTGKKTGGRPEFFIGGADNRSSCRRNSAWMRTSCAAIWRGSTNAASAASSTSSSVSRRCARRNRRAG
jgi:methylenetetrahydrofolate reductase (NADPH)